VTPRPLEGVRKQRGQTPLLPAHGRPTNPSARDANSGSAASAARPLHPLTPEPPRAVPESNPLVYFPCHFGGRFCENASGPSMKSWLFTIATVPS
jgi:hypothetical protein